MVVIHGWGGSWKGRTQPDVLWCGMLRMVDAREKENARAFAKNFLQSFVNVMNNQVLLTVILNITYSHTMYLRFGYITLQKS